MSVRTDQINLNVNVNGNPAQAQLNNLRKSAADLNFELKGMKKGTDEYIAKSKELAGVQTQISQLKQQIGLTSLTMKELNAEHAKLAALKNNVTPLTEEWKKYDAQLAQVIARQSELKAASASTQAAVAGKGGGGGGVFGEIFGGFTLGTAVIEGLAKVKEFFTESIQEAARAERINAQFRATLDNLGRSDAFERLKKSSEELSKEFKTVLEVDITNVFSKLVTYGKLSENQMNALAPVIINFASKQRISLEEATDSITRALEGNARSLKTYGINISDAHSVTERLNIVMTELKERVEGADAAFEKTAAGSLEVTKTKFKQLKEEIGDKLMPVLNGLLAVVNADLSVMGEFFTDVWDGITKTGAQLRKEAYLRANGFKSDLDSEVKSSLSKIHQYLGKEIEENGKKVVVTYESVIASLQKSIDNIHTPDSVRQLQQATLDAVKGEQLKNTPINSNANPDENKQADTLYKELLNKADAFNKKLRDLQQQAVDAGKSKDQQEIDAAKHKFDEILIEYNKLVKELGKSGIHLQFSADDIKKLEGTEIAGLLEKQQREADDRIGRQRIEAAKTEYQNALHLSDAFFEEQKQQRAKDFTDGKIDEAQYQSDIAAIEVTSQQNRLVIAQDYAGQKVTIYEKGVKTEVALVKEADEDVTKFKKVILDKQTADLIAAFKKREENRKLFEQLDEQTAIGHAQAQVKTALPNSDDFFKAQEKLLQAQHQKRLKDLKKQEEDLLKAAGTGAGARAQVENDINQQTADENAVFQQQQIDLDNDATKAKIENAIKYAQQVYNVMGALDNFLTARENKLLSQDQKANDAKKNQYKKQLDNKLISQSQYDLKTQALDDDLDKKKKALEREQAKRQKALQIFQALISTAAAVAEALPDVALSIIVGIAGAAEVALIAATPLPELGTGKWVRKGAKHKDKEGGIPVKIERDEAVMNADAMTDPEVVTVTGNTAQITSALNSRKGRGVSWSGGAQVLPAWRTERPASINPGMVRVMANGGAAGNVQSAISNGDTNDLLKTLIQKQEENTEEIKTMKTKLHAVVSIKEYRQEEALYDAAKKASGLNQ